MNLKKKIELYINGRTENNDIRDIINKLPRNEQIAKDILEILNNKTTELKCDDDIKGSYYVFLNDTIYLSNNKASKEYSRLTLIAHECVHSIQSKVLQIINFLLSNLEIIFFVIIILLKILNVCGNKLDFTYLIIVISSIIVRVILELDASVKSISLSKDYVNVNLNEEYSKIVTKIIRFQVMALFPFMLISLFFWKIIRLIIINIL
jgi:hypothetical protein